MSTTPIIGLTTPIASTSKLPVTPPRYFHSTPSSRILPFFGLGDRDTPQQHAENFLRHLGKDNAEGVSKSYTALRQSIISPERGYRAVELDKTSLLAAEDLTQAVRLLSATAHINSDFRMLETIYHDITDIWEFEAPTSADETTYVEALVHSGRLSKAERWLERHRRERRCPSWPSRTEDWNVLLDGWTKVVSGNTERQVKPYARIKAIVHEKMAGCGRNIETWNSLLAIAFATADIHDGKQVIQEVQHILSQIRKDGLQANEQTWATILAGHAALQQWDNAEEALSHLQAGAETIDVSNARLGYSAARDGLDAALASLRDMPRSGARPDESTLYTLLRGQLLHTRHSRSTASPLSAKELRQKLLRLEDATGMIPKHGTYALAMQHAETFQDCASLHKDAQRDGVPMSAGMLRAAVLHMATPTLPEELAMVQNMYNDLFTSRLSDDRNPEGIHNVGLYADLLQLCARRESPNFAWAIQLLEDMRHNGLALLSSAHAVPAHANSAASLVASLMRTAATNHSQAFKIYSWTWPMDPDHIFTSRDWHHIIRTFADSEYPVQSDGKRSYIPASVFFAFFEDMRKSGTPPQSDVFQAVLHYYAREGRRSGARSNQEAVRQIHDVIKMDQFNAVPDIGLMNRLMYAYSKTGNLDGAFNTWRSIVVSKIRYNNVSVSIILDAYGYAGRHTYPQLRALWAKLLENTDFALNRRNLESYIEALGRLGYGKEAVDEVFRQLENSSVGQSDLKPDERTLEVLLKLVRSDDDLFRQALDKTRNGCPDLWRSIKNVASSLPSGEREPKALLTA